MSPSSSPHLSVSQPDSLHGDTTKDDFDEPSRAPAPRASTLRLTILVLTCTGTMILNIANSTAVSIALPTIGRDLNIAESRLQWIVSAYSLSSGCLLLFLGRVADLYGRKLIYLLGLIFLGVFSLGCGFAQNDITIDILRGLQGIGGAAVIPSALGILAHAFPPSPARAIAFATFSAGAPIGAALGTLLGGVLTQLTAKTWRSSFYLMAGLSALCFLGGILTIEADVPSTEKDRRLDWLGAFLVTAGLICLVFVLSDGSIAPNGWKTSYIIALLVLGIVLLALFICWESYLERVQDDPHAVYSRWTPPPLMRPSIWSRASGKLAIMLFVVFVEWCGFMAFTFWVQLYYQNFLLLSPVLTMVRLLPMFVTGVLCNVIVALVIGRVDVVVLIALKLPLVSGTALTAVANLLFAVINPSSPYWAFGFPAAITAVFGADFVFSAGTLFVAKVSLPHEQSVAGALFQTMTQLGNAFGLAISTIIFNATLTKQSRKLGVEVNLSGTNAPIRAQLSAYHSANWGGFAFGVLGALLALVFLRGVGIVGQKAPVPERPDDEKSMQMEVDSPATRNSNASTLALGEKFHEQGASLGDEKAEDDVQRVTSN